MTCGGGSQSRHRGTDGPYYGGKSCIGDADEYRDCNTDECPGLLKGSTGALFLYCVCELLWVLAPFDQH